MPFSADSFVAGADANLSTHASTGTGSTGATWAKVTAFASGSIEISHANSDVYSTTANQVVYILPDTPTSPNYSVQSTMTVKSLPTDSVWCGGVALRSDAALDEKYGLIYLGGSGLNYWVIVVSNGTGGGSSSSTTPYTLVVGHRYRMTITGSGSTITGTVFDIDAATTVASITYSDTTISTAGKGGLFLWGGAGTGDTTGLHMSAYSATNAIAVSYSSFRGNSDKFPILNSNPFATQNDFDGTQTLSALGFTDPGSGWTVGGNALTGPSGSTDWQTKPLISSGTLDSLNSTVTAYISHASTDVAVVQRLQRGSGTNYNCYWAEWKAGTLSIVSRVTGNTLATLGTKAIALTSGHDWRIDFWVRPNGTSGTDLTASVSDTTTSTVIDSLTISGDATAGLQAIGASGLLSWGGAATVTQFRVLQGANIASSSSSAPISGTRQNLILCVGDSRTEGDDGTGVQINPTYPSALQTLFGNNAVVLNYGYSGQYIDDIMGYMPTPDYTANPTTGVVRGLATNYSTVIRQSMDRLDYGNIKIVFNEIINQLGQSQNPPVSSPSGQTNTDIYNRLKQAVLDWFTYGADQVYVCTDPASATATTASWTAAYYTRLAAINDMVRANYSWATGLIDLQDIAVAGAHVFFDQSTTSNGTYYTPDTTHLEPAGAALWASAVYGYITNTAVIPYLTSQPANASTSVGSPITLNSVGAGIPSPTVQWYSGAVNAGTPVSGATSPSFSPPATSAGSTSYYAAYSNATGIVFSTPATVTVTTGGSGGSGSIPNPGIVQNHDGTVSIVGGLGVYTLFTLDGTTPDASTTPQVGAIYKSPIILPYGTTVVSARDFSQSAPTNTSGPVLTQSNVVSRTLTRSVTPPTANVSNGSITPPTGGNTALGAAMQAAATAYSTSGIIGLLSAGTFGNIQALGGTAYEVYAADNRTPVAIVHAYTGPTGNLHIISIEQV